MKRRKLHGDARSFNVIYTGRYKSDAQSLIQEQTMTLERCNNGPRFDFEICVFGCHFFTLFFKSKSGDKLVTG